MSAYADIQAERNRQVQKWGEQSHAAGLWALILGEEFGEVCNAALEGDFPALREELVQLAAVAVAWVEHLDRLS